MHWHGQRRWAEKGGGLAGMGWAGWLAGQMGWMDGLGWMDGMASRDGWDGLGGLKRRVVG